MSDLDLHVDVNGGRPGLALLAALRQAIRDGRLPPDSRLPAARALAADLGISRNTVADVYAQLAEEGWVESRVGAGTWVAGQLPVYEQAAQRRAASRRWIDLRGGIPDPSGFSRREWVAATRRATLEASTADLHYPDPAGVAPLRSSLAAYVARTRGVAAADPARIVVGQGFGELLVLIGRALRLRGVRRLAVEEYGHATHRRLLAATGLELVALPVDEAGADIDSLEDLNVGGVLLTPAHQFPLGVALAPERRRAVVEWAQRTGAVLIEDDYDGEFRYDRRAVGSLQSLAPDRVAYLGTASKAVAPAVGLAWAVTPGWLLPDVVEQRELAGGQPAALQQLALASFIDSHDYDRSVRRLRGVYRARRARLEAVVAAQLPGCEVTGLAAGLQCILTLPAHVSEAAVEHEAAHRGLRLEGLNTFRVDPVDPGRPALVIGYGGPTPGQYDAALRLLVESVRAAAGPD